MRRSGSNPRFRVTRRTGVIARWTAVAAGLVLVLAALPTAASAAAAPAPRTLTVPWTVQAHYPAVTSDFSDGSCPTVSTCLVVGDGGIARTTDGGTTWSLLPVPGNPSPRGVTCGDAQHCLIWDTGVYRTNDGGMTWQQTIVPQMDQFTNGDCVTASVCMGLAAYDGPVVRSTNGGQSWTATALPTGIDPYALSCATTTSCFIAAIYQTTTGPINAILSTTNGTTWNVVSYLPGVASLGTGWLSCPSAQVCTLVNNDLALTTADAWSTFTDEAAFHALAPAADSISCATASACVVAGGTVAYTTDGGATWQPSSVPAGTSTPVSCTLGTDRCIIPTAVTESLTAPTGIWLSGDGGATFTTQTLPDQLGPMSSVACPSTSMCMAVGADVASTTDGGAQWTLFDPPPGVSGSLSGVTCASPTWCVALDGSAYLTTDAGATWSTMALPSGVGVGSAGDLSCPLAGTCMLLAAEQLYSTDDGGSTWTPVTLPILPAGIVLNAVDCTDASDCVIVGGNTTGSQVGAPTLLVTHDGGTMWTSPTVVAPGAEAALTAVSCPTVQRCTAVGGSSAGGFSVTSSDGGSAWSVTPLGAVQRFGDLTCGNATNCWTIATSSVGGRSALATANGGRTWSQVTLPGVSSGTGANLACPAVSACHLVVSDPVHGVSLLTSSGAAPVPTGYWLAAADGGVFAFGRPFYGSMGGTPLNRPIVGMAATPDLRGYWLVASDGGIFSFGDARFYGSTGGITLNQPIVGMAPTPDGGGYWLVAADGGIFSFGDAFFWGSLGGQSIPAPIVGMTAAPFGYGYWLAGADGTVYPFGPGAIGHSVTNPVAPVTGIAQASPVGGYWLPTANGGVYTLGGAPFYGAASGGPLNGPAVGLVGTADAGGYWILAADGGVFAFGDAPFKGSMGGRPLAAPIVGGAGA